MLNNSSRPNILMLVVDCLRLDRIIDGDHSVVTPEIDRLRQTGVTFTQAIAAATTTLPSFASILTGSFPPATHVRAHVGSKLNSSLPTLAEELQRAGYHTRAEVTGPLLPLTGLDRGFTVYHCRPGDRSVHSDWGQRLLAQVTAMAEPWFLLLHSFELHAPLQILPRMASPEFGRTGYDQALSSLDTYIGAILARLPANTIVVLTGDHGEITPDQPIAAALLRSRAVQWFSHRVLARFTHRRVPPLYVGHGVFPVDELLRPPLLLAAPGLPRGHTVAAQVRHVDIAPTLLDLVGLDAPAAWSGQTLRPLWEQEEGADRVAYAEVGKVIFDRENWCVTVRRPPHKLYAFPYSNSHRPILERTDTGERLAVERDAQRAVVQELQALLDAILASAPEATNIGMTTAETDELKQRLQDLGYL